MLVCDHNWYLFIVNWLSHFSLLLLLLIEQLCAHFHIWDVPTSFSDEIFNIPPPYKNKGNIKLKEKYFSILLDEFYIYKFWNMIWYCEYLLFIYCNLPNCTFTFFIHFTPPCHLNDHCCCPLHYARPGPTSFINNHFRDLATLDFSLHRSILSGFSQILWPRSCWN